MKWKPTYPIAVCACHGEERPIVNKQHGGLCYFGNLDRLRRNAGKNRKPRKPIKSKAPKRVNYRGTMMQEHTKIYLEALGVDPCDAHKLPCEFMCERTVVDVHHINPRGMGGDPTGRKDTIINLMGLCTKCHDACTEERIPKDDQRQAHYLYLKLKGVIE